MRSLVDVVRESEQEKDRDKEPQKEIECRNISIPRTVANLGEKLSICAYKANNKMGRHTTTIVCAVVSSP